MKRVHGKTFGRLAVVLIGAFVIATIRPGSFGAGLYLPIIKPKPPASSSPPPTQSPPPAPAPTVPKSPSIYWGSFIEGTKTFNYYFGGSWIDAPWDCVNAGCRTWNKFETDTRKPASIVHYMSQAPWNARFDPAVANKVVQRGAIPMMTMTSNGTTLTDIIAGKYDGQWATWADDVKAWGHPFFLRWDQEMNGDWMAWGKEASTNPGLYVTAWRHIHNIVVAHGATNVTWVWCPGVEPSTYDFSKMDALYPGDEYVDWTAMDGYNFGAGGWEGGWRSFQTIFYATYSHLLSLAPSKPIMIAETGSIEDGGSKATWIGNALTTQLPNYFPGIKALVWFNMRVYDPGLRRYDPWAIESSEAATSAFAGAIASNYYKSNSFEALPLLTKVPTP